MDLDEQSMLALMASLDNGTNFFGPLSEDIRARLYAVVDNPSEDTWDDAKSIPFTRLTTLWQALLRHTTYDVRVGPTAGQPWAAIPTRAQVLTALVAELGQT